MNIKMLKWMNAATVSVARILKFPVLAREHRQLTCKINDGENTLCTFFFSKLLIFKSLYKKKWESARWNKQNQFAQPTRLESQTS